MCGQNVEFVNVQKMVYKVTARLQRLSANGSTDEPQRKWTGGEWSMRCPQAALPRIDCRNHNQRTRFKPSPLDTPTRSLDAFRTPLRPTGLTASGRCDAPVGISYFGQRNDTHSATADCDWVLKAQCYYCRGIMLAQCYNCRGLMLVLCY